MKYISESDLSICIKYHQYINDYLSERGNKTISVPYFTKTPSRYCDFLNGYILSNISTRQDDIDSFIKEMTILCKQDLDNFEWLNNSRLCYRAWLYIKNNGDFIKPRSFDRDVIRIKTDCNDEDLIIDSNSIMRANTVKKHISSLSEKIKKISLINWIKMAGASIEKYSHPFKFKEDDEKLINWTWNYMLPKFQSKFPDEFSQFMRIVIPTSLKEKYHTIIAIHDSIYTKNEYLHKVFCSDYKKALAQKKYREKENVKSINVQIDLEAKKQLDELLYHYQYSQQKFFEILIKERYNSVKNQLDKN